MDSSKIIMYIVMGASVLLLACTHSKKNNGTNNASSTQTEIPFTPIADAPNGGLTEKKVLAIDGEADWKALWKEMHANQQPLPAIPTVDFEKHTLIAAFAGLQSNGGYRILIDKVAAVGNKLAVDVVIEAPGQNCFVTLAMTQPYQIVQIAKGKYKGLQINERTVKRDCN